MQEYKRLLARLDQLDTSEDEDEDEEEDESDDVIEEMREEEEVVWRGVTVVILLL